MLKSAQRFPGKFESSRCNHNERDIRSIFTDDVHYDEEEDRKEDTDTAFIFGQAVEGGLADYWVGGGEVVGVLLGLLAGV